MTETNRPGCRRSRSDRFRVGVIGCSSEISRLRIRAAREDERIEVVAVADPSLRNLRAVARELEVRRAHRSYRAMIRWHRFDGVIVALPASQQAEATIYALDHGCHALCGAPFGSRPQEAWQMIEASARNDRILSAGHLASELHGELWDSVECGRIGSPEGFEAGCRRVSSTDTGGVAAELLWQLLAAGLPLATADPVKVSATSWAGEGEDSAPSTIRLARRIGLAVECANGARGRILVAVGRRGEEHAYIRCEGSAGTLSAPPLLMTGGACGDGQSALIGEAIVAQQELWLRRVRKGCYESLPRDLDLALNVQRVLRAADRSSQMGGKEVDVRPF